MGQNGRERWPTIRVRIVLDAAQIAEHPELLVWAAGPLAEAMAEAPFPVSLMIALLDEDN